VANEIFDAFACDLFIEGKVAHVHGEAIVWQDASPAILEHARRYSIQKGEIASGYGAFAQQMHAAAEAFDFVTFDYGSHAPRNDFSIRIYHEHKVYPLFGDGVKLGALFGRSDLTYDVHFGHLQDAFADANVALKQLAKQANALIDFGIIELLEAYAQTASQAHYLHHADKIKTLIAPDSMGERFKMAWFARV
jgi:SAM-dependent MidA family methyltransferase